MDQETLVKKFPKAHREICLLLEDISLGQNPFFQALKSTIHNVNDTTKPERDSARKGLKSKVK